MTDRTAALRHVDPDRRWAQPLSGPGHRPAINPLADPGRQTRPSGHQAIIATHPRPAIDRRLDGRHSVIIRQDGQPTPSDMRTTAGQLRAPRLRTIPPSYGETLYLQD